MKPKRPVGRPVTKNPDAKPDYLTICAGPTDSIGEVSKRAVKLADARKCPVKFVFQGIEVTAMPGEDGWDVGDRWFKEFKNNKK